MRFFGRALLVGLALAGAAAPAWAGELKKVQMTVTSRTTPASPYFIAIEKGYFAEQGLAVEIVDAGGGVAIPALISGSVDFSMSAAVSVGAIMRGAALRVIYTMADRPPYQLWVTSPELKTVADLKGKQVGIISRGDTFEIAMRLTLRDAGLPADYVAYTPLGAGTKPRQAALAAGALPAIVLSGGDVEPMRGTPGFEKAHMIVDMSKAIRMPYTGVVTSAKLIATDPETVKRFLRGVVRGVRYMRTFETETIEILTRADPQADPRGLDVEYREFMPTLTAEGLAPDDLIRKDLLVRSAIMEIPESSIPPIDRVFDYGPLLAVNAELAKSGWKPTR